MITVKAAENNAVRNKAIIDKIHKKSKCRRCGVKDEAVNHLISKCSYKYTRDTRVGIIIFTNPSAQAGYDTRSIFKRSLTGFNSEFSFS